MKLISYCNKVLEYAFYAIFFFVPLIFAGNTSELFEFNKMWVAFGLTIIIGTSWLTKMIVQRRIALQRTPLDIPLLLFLSSQIISTIFSLDQHISWWGYYSRFNGGLASTICYIFLYYAFVSNFSSYKHDEKTSFQLVPSLLSFVISTITTLIVRSITGPDQSGIRSWTLLISLCISFFLFARSFHGSLIKKLLYMTLVSAGIVALWGFPSHFGADPTCLVFRGNLDTSCWTDAFKPTIRAFSTLGQPAWFAAYLAVLLPLAIAYTIQAKSKAKKATFFILSCLSLVILLYLDLIFANTRGGFYAFIVALIIFWALVCIKKIFTTKMFLRYFLFVNLTLLLCTFFFGIPVERLYQFTLPGLQHQLAAKPVAPPPPSPTQPSKPAPTTPAPDINITDSGDIRLYVWKGAIDAWKANPLFGTGVETFAFAYYQHRPAGHNLTSEWDYLYNKAHNEYLNYLTTTGLFGLGTYLFFIGFFIFLTGKWLLAKNKEHKENALLVMSLVSGWISILVSNFFGFSVVIMNLFLFLIPAFCFILNDSLDPEKQWSFPDGSSALSKPSRVNPYQWTTLIIIYLFAGYLLVTLVTYWSADTKYALGNNLDKTGSYQEAYPLLLAAVKMKPHEPVYADELAINLAVLSTALSAQKDTTNAQQFAQNAITLNNQIVTEHPNNVVFWKNRVRLFYTLAQTDQSHQAEYFTEALAAIQKASELAPTDAKISYNLGILYGQTGNVQKGVAVLQETIKLKPDYRDAYFALGLFYHQLAVDKNDKVIDKAMQQKAIETYAFVLTHVSPKDDQIKKSLEAWKKPN